MQDPYWYFIITPLVLLAIQIAVLILLHRTKKSQAALITYMLEQLKPRDNGNMPSSLDTLRAKQARAKELIEIQKTTALERHSDEPK